MDNKHYYNNIKKITKFGECRTKLDGYEELIRLPFEHQREILCEVIAMKEHGSWEYVSRDCCIKQVIQTSIDRYYPLQCIKKQNLNVKRSI